MKNGKYWIGVFLLCVFTMLGSIGFGSWFVKNEKTQGYDKYPDTTAQKIAYIKNGNSKTYYTTLEKAISVANDNSSENPTVYVIPGIKYTIENKGGSLKTVTINSGVTLSLPFQDELLFEVWKTGIKKDDKGNDVSDGVYNPNGTEFSTTTEALLNPEKYRKTQITIGKNVKLVNNGTINVGGVNGSCAGSKITAGQTCYKFSEIVLNGLNEPDSYQLINNGTIKNQGRIIGGDNSIFGIENASGSNLISNFVVKENKGGAALVGLGGGLGAAFIDKLSFTVSPFNRVYMPNTMVKMKTDYGANITGVANMYGNNANNLCKIPIVSSSKDSLFTLKSGAYLVSNVYLDSLRNKSGTTIINNYEKMKLDFYGSGSMQYMSMSLGVPGFGTRSIKTDGVLFPLSYYQEVSLNSIGGQATTFESSQDLKILPGGSLSIGKNVTFKIGKMAIYDTFEDKIGWGAQIYPKDLTEGTLIASGAFQGNTVGGKIIANGTSASMKIDNVSIVSKEVKGTFGTSISNDNYDNLSFLAHGIVSYNGFSPSDQYILGSQQYSSSNLASQYCWAATINPTIKILDSDNKSSRTIKSTGTSVEIKIAEILPNVSFINVSSIVWNISKKASPNIVSAEDQDYTYQKGTLNSFVFSTKKMPPKYTTWTYTITISAKDINGQPVSCNSYVVDVKK